MDSRIPTNVRSDVAFTQTAPRPTPTPARVPFAEVLAASGRTLAAGAQTALSVLPGAGALGVHPAAGLPLASHVPATPTVSMGGVAVGASPEGPAIGGDPTGGGSIDGALQQSQEMNLYYLQLQQEMNAQNRMFTTLSNVMNSEHETAKTAIGNIK